MSRTRTVQQFFLSSITIFSIVLALTNPNTAGASADLQSGDGLKREYSDSTGKVNFISPANGRPMTAQKALGLTPSARVADPARSFLERFGPEFGLKDPGDETSIMREQEGEDGRFTVRYQQVHEGVPVLAGELIINTDESGDLYSMNGEVSPGLTISTDPSIDAAEARQIAVQAMAKRYQAAPEAFLVSEPALWIYDPRLLGPDEGPAALVWRMEVRSSDGQALINELVLVDAQRGSIALNFNQIDTAWHGAEASAGVSRSAQQDEGTPTPTPTSTQEPGTETPETIETSQPAKTVAPTLDPFEPTPTSEFVAPRSPVNPSAGVNYYVDIVGGNNSNSCTSVAAPCRNIQETINKADTGDTLYVASGTYVKSTNPNPNVLQISKDIVISGGWDAATFTTQSGVSIIDGEDVNNGILILTGTVTIDNFIIQNSFSTDSGAIYIVNGTVTVTDSTLKDNLALNKGAGIYMGGGTLLLINTTLSGNGHPTSTDFGGAIYANAGAVTIRSSTIAYNSAVTGGGLDRNTGTFSITNTILSNNTGSTSAPDCNGIVTSAGYNIIGDTTGCSVSAGSGDQFNVNPFIDNALTDTMQVHALLSGSPAINAGTSLNCPAADERGVTRPQGSACDIGAFERVGSGVAEVLIDDGDDQSAEPSTPFAVNLSVLVLGVNGDPVSGETVTFTAPGSGASGTFSDSTTNVTTAVSNGSGIATAATFTANASLGGFTVDATATGYTPAQFDLAISEGWYVSNTGNDGNSCGVPAEACEHIQAAINKADAGDPIFVAVGTYTGTGSQVVLINKNVDLSGGWDATFASQTGLSTIDGEDARRGVTVNLGITASMESFEMRSGNASNGGGISNQGILTLDDSIVTGNTGIDYNGGIFNGGTLTLNSTTVSGNISDANGGIGNDGTATLNDSTVSDNSATTYSGGIGNSGTLTLNNTTVSGNSGVNYGGIINSYGSITLNNSTVSGNTSLGNGGIFNFGGILTLNNSTVSGNSANTGGGIDNNGTTFLNNSTITNNSANDQGGGIYRSGGTVMLSNSIVAGNTAGLGGPDCWGSISSASHNLIGSTSGCTFSSTTGDQTNVDPLLQELIGIPAYHPLMAGSPAIDAGDSGSCFATDQRGAPRVGTCDIGAYEYTTPGAADSLVILSGSPQHTGPFSAFPDPLTVAVVDSIGSPVSGVTVSFDAPGSGASLIFSDTTNASTTAVSDANGIATSSSMTANGLPGSYTVIASASGASPANFDLTNGAWYVATTGNNGNTCNLPSDPCANVNGVLAKAGFVPGDEIHVAAGTYSSLVNTIDDDTTIKGGWNAAFTAQNGRTEVGDTITVGSGVTVVIEDINITDFVILRGIHNSGDLTLRRVAIYGVISQTSGAAIYQNNGDLVLENVTLADNTVKSGSTGGETLSGGGIFVNGGTVTINNSTIIQNAAIDSEEASLGGGIANPGNFPVTIQNSIIVGNISDVGPDCFGMITSSGHNLLGTSEGCTIIHQSGDQYGDVDVGVNSSLGDLQDNGGRTSTAALLTDSSAIDEGNPATCALTDQRGVARPQGTACDIGAYEGSDSQTVSGIIKTYTAGNVSLLPGNLACAGTVADCNFNYSFNPDITYAHMYATGVYDLYLTKHGRQSFDDHNGPLIVTVDYGGSFDNAVWSGSQLVFGDAKEYARSDDIVAHEMTHGVTQYESNLYYYYQSGAINESLSDLWGEYYDQTNGIGTDSPAVKWLIGEDLVSGGTGAIRSMTNPPAYGDPDKMTSANYYEADGDNGGVHTNSGVNNKAVFLLVDGGTFNGKTVTAIGWDKTAAIYYEANTNLITSGADYADLYNALYQACLNLVGGTLGINSANCQEVRDATDAVEMNLQPATNFNTDAPFCGTLQPYTDVFFDDLESGASNWTADTRWLYGSPYGRYAHSGVNFLYADDFPPTVTVANALLVSVAVPAGAYLRFDHAYDFENYTGDANNYDGGILEYTTNGGTTWADAGSLMNFNGYDGPIASGYGNPLAGRQAFARTSHGYISTRLNLSSLAGQNVIFRWRMGLDTTGYRWGWWLDDVRIYTCDQPTFTDVPFDHAFHDEIEALWDEGLTAGCSTSPLMYCPNTILDRAQAAVFLLRGEFGTGYVPPPAPWPTFQDDWSLSDIAYAQKWAQGLWDEGLTAGCQATPVRLYCPRTQLPRVEASVFGLRMKYGASYLPPPATGTLFGDMTDVNYYGTKWAEQAYLDELLPACGTQSGTGKPLFCPDDLVNRAWGAYLIVQAKDLLP